MRSSNLESICWIRLSKPMFKMCTSNSFFWSRKRFGIRFLLVASSVSNPRGPATTTASLKICDREPLIRLRSSSSCPIKSSLSSIVMASDCRRLASLTEVCVLYQIVISNTNSKVDNHFSKAFAWLSCSMVRSRFFFFFSNLATAKITI